MAPKKGDFRTYQRAYESHAAATCLPPVSPGGSSLPPARRKEKTALSILESSDLPRRARDKRCVNFLKTKLHTCKSRELGVFVAFLIENEHFTKTGSGQT
eukprot:COSAG06_NODE_15055_length_1101_cov_0.773453_1_plen_100_part_00